MPEGKQKSSEAEVRIKEKSRGHWSVTDLIYGFLIALKNEGTKRQKCKSGYR